MRFGQILLIAVILVSGVSAIYITRKRCPASDSNLCDVEFIPAPKTKYGIAAEIEDKLQSVTTGSGLIGGGATAMIYGNTYELPTDGEAPWEKRNLTWASWIRDVGENSWLIENATCNRLSGPSCIWMLMSKSSDTWGGSNVARWDEFDDTDLRSVLGLNRNCYLVFELNKNPAPEICFKRRTDKTTSDWFLTESEEDFSRAINPPWLRSLAPTYP